MGKITKCISLEEEDIKFIKSLDPSKKERFFLGLEVLIKIAKEKLKGSFYETKRNR
jgi:hypothetical protein